MLVERNPFGPGNLILAGILAGLAGFVWEGMRWTVMTEEHPFLLLLAVNLFAWMELWCGGKESFSGLGKLAGNMLGVYIIHPVFIHICMKVLTFNHQLYLLALAVPLVFPECKPMCKCVIEWGWK